MAIAVATDLVLDVLNAGSSKLAEAADAKLKATSSSAVEIAAVGEEFTAQLLASEKPNGLPSANVDLRNSLESTQNIDTFKKFEAVVLEQFVKHMLPEDGSVIYGEGTAGDIWKGMMAQHLGEAIIDGGGIGIAQQLAKSNRADNINQASNIIFNQERDVLESLSKTSSTENDK